MKLFGALLLCHACLGYKVAVDKQDPAAREVQLLNDRLFQDVSEPVEALNQESYCGMLGIYWGQWKIKWKLLYYRCYIGDILG